MSVYFIEALGARRVKIGFADDPAIRLRQLQTGCPHELRLLFSVPGNRAVEQHYHERYAHLRIDKNSEWFYFDAELKQLINAAMMYDPHRVEMHHGLPVLRGILTNITENWFQSSDGTTESPNAYLQIWCPECRRHHRHGWSLHDDYDVVSRRAAHCDKDSAYRMTGYFIGVVKQAGVHCHPPGEPIVRPVRRRRPAQT